MPEPQKAPYEPLVVYERPGHTEYIYPDPDQLWRDGVLAGLLRRSLEGLGDDCEEVT